MKPSKQLIDILRTTADKVESGEIGYRWCVPSRCNCGCVAQVALNLSVNELDDQLQSNNPISGVWSDQAEYEYSKCFETGLFMHTIFKKLEEIGFEQHDYYELEYLGGIQDYDYPKEFIKFIRNKADFLETQLLSQQLQRSEQSEQHIGVTV